MKPDQERVKALLTDTVTLLCKNGLHYSKEMKVQGLLGITLDENDVFVVHINEKFGDLIGGEVSLHADEETKAESSPDKKPKHHKSHSDAEPPRARKRRNSRDSPDSPSPSKHHKDSRTYSTDSDSSSRVPPLSSPSHSGSAPGTPGDATPRIKKEEEVIFLDAEGEQRSSCSRDSVSRRDDRNAMQQTYSNLSLTDIQSGFAQLEQVPGVDMPGSMDSVAGSPAKHKPGEGFQAPFVTGMMRHQGPGSQSGGEGDSSSGSAWDNSALSNLSQMNPDGSDSSGWSQSQMQAQSQNTAGSQGGENSITNSPQLPFTWPSRIPQDADCPDYSPSKYNTNISSTQYLPCILCGKMYKTRDNLRRHMKTHNPNLLQCKTCVLFFKSQEELDIHKEKKHSGLYFCSVCNRNYSSQENLNQHVSTYHGNKL